MRFVWCRKKSLSASMTLFKAPPALLLLAVFTFGFVQAKLSMRLQADESFRYTTNQFDQIIDHFTPSSAPKTFQQKYLVDTSNWNGPTTGCTVLLLIGCEDPIEILWRGHYWYTEELPAILENALVIGLEHRYFGTSLPFGTNSLEADNIVYLTLEQALADYATMIPELRTQFDANHTCAWVHKQHQHSLPHHHVVNSAQIDVMC
jgi:hypothetical protein